MATSALTEKVYVPCIKAELQSFLAPITAESFNPHVACYICGANCLSAGGLRTHMIKHGAAYDDLVVLRDLRNADDRRLYHTDRTVAQKLEFTMLKPVTHGKPVLEVECACGKIVTKPSLKYHLQKSKQHKDAPVSDELVIRFSAFKDGRQQEKKGADKLLHNTFEVAYKLHTDMHRAGAASSPAATAPPPEQVPSPHTQEIQAHTAALIALMKHQLAPGQTPPRVVHDTDVHMQAGSCIQAKPGDTNTDIEIRRAAKAFVVPTKVQMLRLRKRRNFTWPCGTSCGAVDLSPFFKEKRCKKHNILYAKMFFSMFKFKGRALGMREAFTTLYQNGMMRDAFDLDIMSERTHWAHKIFDAMSALADVVALQAEEAGDTVAATCANNFNKRFKTPTKGSRKGVKADNHERRKQLDRRRQSELAPTSLRNYTAVKAAHDIGIIHRENIEGFKATGILPKYVQRCLNALMTAYLQNRTAVNRPGEWNRFPLDKMQACVDDAAQWYVVIDDHKTIATAGELGRLISDEVKKPMRLHLELQCKEQNLLFPPPRGQPADGKSRRYTQLHRNSEYFAHAFTPDHQYTEPTLDRKTQRSMIKDKANRAKAAEMSRLIESDAGAGRSATLWAAVSAHDEPTGDKHYDLTEGSPELQALTIKAFVQVFLGELPVLTDEDAAMYETRTTADIIKQFRDGERAAKLAKSHGPKPIGANCMDGDSDDATTSGGELPASSSHGPGGTDGAVRSKRRLPTVNQQHTQRGHTERPLKKRRIVHGVMQDGTGGAASCAKVEWNTTVEAFLRDEKQVNPRDSAGSAGRVCMTVVEKRVVLTQLGDLVAASGMVCQPTAQWAEVVKMRAPATTPIRDIVKAASIAQLAVRFMDWRLGATASGDGADMCTDHPIAPQMASDGVPTAVDDPCRDGGGDHGVDHVVDDDWHYEDEAGEEEEKEVDPEVDLLVEAHAMLAAVEAEERLAPPDVKAILSHGNRLAAGADTAGMQCGVSVWDWSRGHGCTPHMPQSPPAEADEDAVAPADTDPGTRMNAATQWGSTEEQTRAGVRDDGSGTGAGDVPCMTSGSSYGQPTPPCGEVASAMHVSVGVAPDGQQSDAVGATHAVHVEGRQLAGTDGDPCNCGGGGSDVERVALITSMEAFELRNTAGTASPGPITPQQCATPHGDSSDGDTGAAVRHSRSEDPAARIRIHSQPSADAVGDAFASGCITSFLNAERPVRRHAGPICMRSYLEPPEKRYVLTVCMQQCPLSQPGPNVTKCEEWLAESSEAELPVDAEPKTMVELCKRFRRYLKLAIETKAAEMQAAATESTQVYSATHPMCTAVHVRVAMDLGVAPELLVTPLPPDDFCLLYAPIAARAGPTWMESRNSTGYLIGEATKDLQCRQEGAAQRLKLLLAKRTRAAGKTVEAHRLTLNGRAGWPGEDNFQELAELCQCKLQCFSLDNDGCLMPHATAGSSDRFTLNIGHYKTGHFVLLAGSVVSDADPTEGCNTEGGDAPTIAA